MNQMPMRLLPDDWAAYSPQLRTAAALHALCKHFGFEGAEDAFHNEIDALVRDVVPEGADADEEIASETADWLKAYVGRPEVAVSWLLSSVAPAKRVPA